MIKNPSASRLRRQWGTGRKSVFTGLNGYAVVWVGRDNGRKSAAACSNTTRESPRPRIVRQIQSRSNILTTWTWTPLLLTDDFYAKKVRLLEYVVRLPIFLGAPNWAVERRPDLYRCPPAHHKSRPAAADRVFFIVPSPRKIETTLVSPP